MPKKLAKTTAARSPSKSAKPTKTKKLISKKKSSSSSKAKASVSRKSSSKKASQKSSSRKGSSISQSAFSSAFANLSYNHGFGNHIESEAEKGALPQGRNNPQRCPMDLMAEQLSGTPFTFGKDKNQRSWLYRILPTCKHNAWADKSSDYAQWVSNFDQSKGLVVTPEQLRWTPQKFSNTWFHKYDLMRFNTMGSISFDHPDPSIFTVLTIQTDNPGQAALDFVIFPPRWLVAENTFKPPYYHRNCMSEFMGNISGTYDAKEAGFAPGASSLHSCMSGHGPEAEVFEKASTADLKPIKTQQDSLAFMFETCYMLKMTNYAMKEAGLDKKYRDCWQGIKPKFSKGKKN